MSNRNITLSLPADLIRRAKIYAAAHDTSISAMVAEVLSDRVAVNDDYDTMWAEQMAEMRKGFGPGFTPITWKREDLYERNDPERPHGKP
ncbi:MAG: DUF6364 family protein [Microbacterium sp.]